MTITKGMHDVLETMKLIVQELINNEKEKERLINSFIDGYVFISNGLENRNIVSQDIKVIQKLGNILVSVVERFNSNEISQGESIINRELIPFFSVWGKTISSHLKHKLVICGINVYSPKFHELLDDTEYEVVGYLNLPEVDLEAEAIGNVPIFSLNNIQDNWFDYIVIVSEHYNAIEEVLGRFFAPEKTINYMKYAIEYSSLYNNLFLNVSVKSSPPSIQTETMRK
ncbi:hypothetical protein [Paenibacillus medicaginis]